MARPAFGVEFYQYVDAPTVLAEARLAEPQGYASLWLHDSQQLWRDLETD